MSLGLVAYDDSEEDSDTEVESGNDPKTTIGTSHATPHGNKNPEEHESENNSPANLSDTIAEPSAKLHIPESKVSLLNTDIDIKTLTSAYQRSGPVKITIPSLNEIQDDAEEPSKKKIKPSKKGSGLFALLPNPKGALVPQSVAHKRNNASSIKQNTSKTSKPKPRAQVKTTLINYEDSDDEESTGTDFFSLEKTDDVTSDPVDVHVDLTEEPEVSKPPETNNDALQFSESFHPSSWQPSSSSLPAHPETLQQPPSEYPTQEFMTFSNSDLELDQEAMQQLCGRRDRLKMHEVSLIDVSGDAIMPDSREWLTKQMTEEQAHRPSHKKRDGPTSQQKRKHQITYLAYQAKENELELKNQWSNNRMSRKQTQAKYGF